MLWVWEKRPPAAMLKALKSQTRLELGPAQSPNLERLLARQFRFHPLGYPCGIEILERSGVREGGGGGLFFLRAQQQAPQGVPIRD
jgi:hypothetical protein